MEGDRGDLVADAGEKEDDRDHERQLRRGLAAEGVGEKETAGDVGQLRADPALAGDARRPEQSVEDADPVEHDAGGDAAVDDVLERRLVGAAPAALEAGEHVADQRDRLDAQVDEQQIGRARHQVHAEQESEE